MIPILARGREQATLFSQTSVGSTHLDGDIILQKKPSYRIIPELWTLKWEVSTSTDASSNFALFSLRLLCITLQEM